MARSLKIGYEGIELDLPVHALYLYRGNEQLLDNVSPLINDGLQRREKIIYIGLAQNCRKLRKSFGKKITALSSPVPARNFTKWLKSQYGKLPKSREGLRVLMESNSAFIDQEAEFDDFNRQPDIRVFLLCMYEVSNITSIELIEILKVDPLQTPPRLGTLTGNLQGCYSRRINIQHRLIYEVFEKTKTVHVLRMWSHYGE